MSYVNGVWQGVCVAGAILIAIYAVPTSFWLWLGGRLNRFLLWADDVRINVQMLRHRPKYWRLWFKRHKPSRGFLDVNVVEALSRIDPMFLSKLDCGPVYDRWPFSIQLLRWEWYVVCSFPAVKVRYKPAGRFAPLSVKGSRNTKGR